MNSNSTILWFLASVVTVENGNYGRGPAHTNRSASGGGVSMREMAFENYLSKLRMCIERKLNRSPVSRIEFP